MRNKIRLVGSCGVTIRLAILNDERILLISRNFTSMFALQLSFPMKISTTHASVTLYRRRFFPPLSLSLPPSRVASSASPNQAVWITISVQCALCLMNVQLIPHKSRRPQTERLLISFKLQITAPPVGLIRKQNSLTFCAIARAERAPEKSHLRIRNHYNIKHLLAHP